MAEEKKEDYQVEIRDKAKKELSKISFPWQNRIQKAIDKLADNRFLGEKMTGEYKNSYKLRIWPYRVLYTIKEEDKVIYIWRIKHRGNIGYRIF